MPQPAWHFVPFVVTLLLSNTNDAHCVLINLSLVTIGNWIMRCYCTFHATGIGTWAYIVYIALHRSKILHTIKFFREMRLKILSLKKKSLTYIFAH